ncbi:MAG TPA: spore cortex biosynthesis protein YabQ [Virgibacillus sp.]|nr:spore cortex biosynthesis protein YabQ [Virgibacillus sp.]
MTLTVQFTTMIAMVLCGFYFGIALDTLRRFTPYWRDSRFMTYFMEISFWFTQTLFLFYVLYVVNAGELRVYVFVACFLGYSVYQVVAANIYKKVLEVIIQLIQSIYQFCKKVGETLIFRPIKWTFSIILRILRMCSSIIFYIVNLIFVPFRWFLQLLNFLLPKKITKYFNKIAQFYSILKRRSVNWVKYIMSKRR